ncbi:hypothetical protein ARSQ2_01832 [Arsenophonus endosymbiont of Bemisia tabaci Q2]|nr:hypothetical protein ARSQ2_01832 [Arsenophonus endosymbiont of Bemisia tabaci Q2]
MLFAIGLFDININSDVFYAWVTEVLIDAGHMVEYLPTYSPDLNPIEHKWPQAKCKKRALGCETDILFALNIV